MDCKLIREQILTDYSDGQMAAAPLRVLENHLMHCLACRLLAEKVQQETVLPFKQAQASGVDEFVWWRIKTKIEQVQTVSHAGVGAADLFRGFVHSFKPALVVASLFIMLTVTFMFRHNFLPHPSYLTYMMATENQGGNDDLSKGIEQYFL